MEPFAQLLARHSSFLVDEYFFDSIAFSTAPNRAANELSLFLGDEIRSSCRDGAEDVVEQQTRSADSLDFTHRRKCRTLLDVLCALRDATSSPHMTRKEGILLWRKAIQLFLDRASAPCTEDEVKKERYSWSSTFMRLIRLLHPHAAALYRLHAAGLISHREGASSKKRSREYSITSADDSSLQQRDRQQAGVCAACGPHVAVAHRDVPHCKRVSWSVGAVVPTHIIDGG